ncbi:hypothetical protein F442_14728 [Phytophthora nicotianae P10297]|uniref:Uncharacterized protein n=1 Tax=Phytophthora nicotianae P10297 TaxID=1317064 RepID=W2YR08_PHYNI|nr:hypothetical protein F442_14728 [Phytophthora nicotianae P10297]
MGTSVAETQKHFSFSNEINSYTDDQRQRVLSTAREGGNWAQVALHNGIAYQTAWRWVNRARTTNVWTPSVGQRGGPRRVKITPEHVEYMLNPIENVFSVFKSGVKSYLAEHRDAILRPPRGVTKAEHRASYMIRAAKHSMSTKVTSELCDSEAAHTLSFHARALDLEDMPVGS